jgi:hypothetical protein
VIEAAVKVLPLSGADRAIAVPSEGGYFVAVADGAGGTGGGASAGDRLIVALTKLTAQAASADWWSVLLATISLRRLPACGPEGTDRERTRRDSRPLPSVSRERRAVTPGQQDGSASFTVDSITVSAESASKWGAASRSVQLPMSRVGPLQAPR